MRRVTLAIAFFFRAVGCAAAFSPAIASASPALMQIDDAERLAAELCQGWNTQGEVYAIEGPRVSWVGAAATARRDEMAQRLSSIIAQHPAISIAMNGRWIVVRARPGAAHRRTCAGGAPETVRVPEPLRQIVISSSGDLASLTDSGAIVIIGAQESGVGTVEVPAQPNQRPTHLVWSGRRLLAIGAGFLRVIVPTGTTQSGEVREVGGAARPVDAAFLFGGLLHVVRENCWDLYAGADLRPWVLGVSCQATGRIEGPYFVIDRDHVSLRSAANVEHGNIPRPSLLVMEISGNMHDVTKSLKDLIRATRPSDEKAYLTRAAANQTPTEPWSQWLKRDAWSSSRDQEMGLRAIVEHRWGNLQQDGTWWVGTGIAASWQSRHDIVKLKHRSLDELGRQLTFEGRFSDRQIAQIIQNNRSLNRTLEGVLIGRGWLPTGALYGNSSELTYAFDVLSALRREAADANKRSPAMLRILRDCQPRGEPTTDPNLSSMLMKGISVAGGIDGALGYALGTPTGAELAADRARVIDCVPPADVPREEAKEGSTSTFGVGAAVQLLVLDAARMGAQADGRRLFLTSAIVTGRNGRTYRHSRDERWPVAIDGEVVVGIRLKEADKDAAYLDVLRSWLNRIVSYHPRLDELLMPIAVLRVALAADAGDRSVLADIDNLLPLSTESWGGQDRASADDGSADQDTCATPQGAAQRRKDDEKLVGLDTVPFDARSLTEIDMAIAEKAIDVLNPIFKVETGQIWVQPDENGDIRPLPSPIVDPVSTATSTDKLHGTEVAAILAATGSLKGLFPDLRPIWIDLRKPVLSLLESLRILASRGVIINVSQKLEENWWTDLSKEAAGQVWQESALFVAAAKNLEEKSHGMPLLSRFANVMGVGVADKNGNISPDTGYTSDVVDVLASGEHVPTLDHHGALVCTSGTSFANAYASAVAALLVQALDNRELNVMKVRARLLATANWKPAYHRQVKGGLLNAARALTHIDDNLLTVSDQSTETTFKVAFNEQAGGAFKINGELLDSLPTGSRDIHRVEWLNVLRIQFTNMRDGRRAYRVSFIDKGQYVVVEDAILLSPEAPIPLKGPCVNINKPTESTQCSGMATDQITEYVARFPAKLFINKF